MKIVMVESPFEPSETVVAQYRGRYSRAELLRQNLIYARLALRNALGRGETPLVAHLLYPQVWGDKNTREAGINAGTELYHRVDLSALYVDLGASEEMREAQSYANLIGVEVTRRMLFNAGEDDVRRDLHGLGLATFPRLDELLSKETTTLSAGNGR